MKITIRKKEYEVMQHSGDNKIAWGQTQCNADVFFDWWIIGPIEIRRYDWTRAVKERFAIGFANAWRETFG